MNLVTFGLCSFRSNSLFYFILSTIYWCCVCVTFHLICFDVVLMFSFCSALFQKKFMIILCVVILLIVIALIITVSVVFGWRKPRSTHNSCVTSSRCGNGTAVQFALTTPSWRNRHMTVSWYKIPVGDLNNGGTWITWSVMWCYNGFLRLVFYMTDGCYGMCTFYYRQFELRMWDCGRLLSRWKTEKPYECDICCLRSILFSLSNALGDCIFTLISWRCLSCHIDN